MKHFLIVVDMQKDFVDGALGTPEAQAIVGKVMDKILGFDGQIFATLDTHRQNYLDTPPKAKNCRCPTVSRERPAGCWTASEPLRWNRRDTRRWRS